MIVVRQTNSCYNTPSVARRKKKSNNSFHIISLIGKPFYYFLYFSGSFLTFSLEEFFKLIKGQKEIIIYKAKDFRKKRKTKEFKVKITFIQKLNLNTKVKILIYSSLTFCAFCFLIWHSIFRDLPSPKNLIERKISVSTKIYDRNGSLLYQVYKNENRTLINLGEVPNNLKLATLASEDVNFYNEPGFSLKGIFRALIADLTNKNIEAGGSTITQQLVKNTLLSPEKTLIRKIKELILSLEVEHEFPKDKILEMYFNQVPYGGSAYGVEAASEQYFGKSVEKLDLAESALLAGLPKSPTTYSPFGEHPELAFLRQKEVLDLMYQNGFITKKQTENAKNEKLDFTNNEIDIKAPHFVMYVRQELVDEFGEDEVESGGLQVITTLDENIQDTAQEAVTSEIEKLRNLHVSNGAAIVLDPKSGEILAMVGSKNYFDTKNDGNVNVTEAVRPPGSSIKLVNYAYALSNGFTPATIIDDSPVVFKFTGSSPYTPVNYDGKFVGKITLRNALAQSRNVPAVKVLASYGVDHMIEMGKEMGITTWNQKNTYGLSLTLGGAGTKLIDLARVYATVADYGNRPLISSIKSITDYKGDELKISCKDTNCNTERVLDPRVAFELISILSDNNARAPEFGTSSSLVIRGHPEVAVKTGTSNDLRDNLTIGFNTDYLTAVWVGNNDNSPMAKIASGITGAAPIWNKIMNKLLLNAKSIAWNTPEGMISVPCPNENEWFAEEVDTKSICQKVKEASSGGELISH